VAFDNRITFDWMDNKSGLEIVGGARASHVDSDDPLPMKDRGLWFDGEHKYLWIQEFQLHHTFTTEFWALSKRDSVPRPLLTIIPEDSENPQLVIKAGAYFEMFYQDHTAMTDSAINT
jgi:hypothetical protein